MLMHGLHWAWALPMQADRRIEQKKKKNLPQSVSSSNQNLMFLSDMHSFRQCPLQVSHPNVRFALSVLLISLPEIHIQHYISGGEKKKVAVAVLWNFWGGGSGSWNPGGPAALIIAWVCLGGTCLPVPRKIISASRNKQREKRCTLAWANPSILCFVFLLCILLFLSSQFSVSLSLSKFRARAWVDLRGLKKQGARPHRTAYVCVFVCVPGICRSLTLRRMRRQRCNTLPGDRRGTSWYACRLLIYLIDVLSLSSARQYTERIIDHLYNSFCV